MKHALKGVAVFGCALALLTCPALAQQAAADTTVTVPWGAMLAGILVQAQAGLTALLLGALSALVLKMPGWLQGLIATAKVEQVLERAIGYAVATTAGAVQGEALTVDTGNKVVKQAVEYVLTHAPAWLVKWMGGEDKIAQKVIARLDVAKSAALG